MEGIGAVLLLALGAALPVLVIVAIVRAFRQQLRDADAAKRRRMRNAELFVLAGFGASIAAISIGLEAVVVLGGVWLVVFLGALPFIARSDLRGTPQAAIE